ncbi:MAG TPA: hypothetical protein VFB77_05125 [Acidimicrobiales bacterium]|nr:hypothetical protein [Acidimicrobiales bacterium]
MTDHPTGAGTDPTEPLDLGPPGPPPPADPTEPLPFGPRELPTAEWPVPPGPQPYGAYGPYPVAPPPRRSGMHGCLVAMLVVVALGLLAVVGGCVALTAAVENQDDGETDESERTDVGDPTCRVDGVDLLVADVPVTNRSSKRSNYIVTLSFEAADGSQLATSVAFVNALEPGQSATATANALRQAPADGRFSCRVIDVERFSDVG